MSSSSSAPGYLADMATMSALQSGDEIPAPVDRNQEFTQTIGVDLRTSWSKLALADGADDRLQLLCELPLQFGEQTCLESLLQIIVERLTAVIPGAVRGALLLVEEGTGNLLLKAHLPPGRPAVSLKLAQRAIHQREAFILSEDQDANASMQELSSMSSMYAPLLWQDEVLGVVCVDNPRRGQPFADADLRLLLAVARYAALAVANLRLQSESQQNALLLGRVLTSFSPKVRERLLTKARQGKMRLGGDRSEVTILCADIRGFTRLSASMDAQEVMDLLNHYFPTLVDAVFRFNGTVDKYIGDAILAVFGSPDPDSAQYENAARAAAHMQSAMSVTNAERRKRGLTTCDIGIGIHCGEVLHGFIGSPDRMEFTVIGDVVNKATRYCDSAKAGEILISPKVYEYIWRMIQAETCNISTKHEGILPAYKLIGVRST
jgi:adenylate cyclase